MKQLDLRLIGMLTLFGPAMGALVVAGVFPEGTDRFGWLVVMGICAFVIARRVPGTAFQHGAIVGFTTGATATLLQGILLTPLISNNPWILETFANKPEGFDLKYFVMMLVPFIGVASALMLGGLSYLVERLTRRRESHERD